MTSDAKITGLDWTLRRIEAATGIRRETVSGYLRAAGVAVRGRGGQPKEWPPKPAIAPEVSTDPGPSKPAITGTVSTDPSTGKYRRVLLRSTC